MLVFDTNVLSELMRPTSNAVIASWVAERATSTLHLTAVSEAELRYGLAIMPRNVRDFADAGIDVADPWADA